MVISKQKRHLKNLVKLKENRTRGKTESSERITISERGERGVNAKFDETKKRQLDTEHHYVTRRQKRHSASQNPVIEQPKQKSFLSSCKYFEDSDLSEADSSDSGDSDESNDDSDYGSDDEPDSTSGTDYATANDSHEPSHISKLKWRSGAGKYLRGAYGNGSRTTAFRQRQNQAMLHQEASKHYSIKAMFERQTALSLLGANQASDVIPLNNVDRRQPAGPADKRAARLEASRELKRLVDFPTEQRKKYGYILFHKGNFYRRHQMVLSFLWAQEHRNDFPELTRRGLAKMIAAGYNKGSVIARRIVQWEKSWIKCRTIPEKKTSNKDYNTIWMNEEDITCAVREFARSQGERT